MLIKLCFQDYVYLYHGKLSIRDLHKFIQDNITTGVVFLKWVDQENEEISLIRDEDLDYVANFSLTNFRILLRECFKKNDSPQREIPLLPQVSFGQPNIIQPRYFQRTQTQYLDQKPRHRKGTSEDMSQDVLLDTVIEGLLEEVYPEFGIEKNSSGPIMVQSQNLFTMRESFPTCCVNRDTITHQQQLQQQAQEQQQQYQYQQQQQQQQQQTTSVILQSRRKSAIPFDKQLYCDYCSKIFNSDKGFFKCLICRDFEVCMDCENEYRQGQLFSHDHDLEFVKNQEHLQQNQY